jgi:4'-phosphopantetheinyl transferase
LENVKESDWLKMIVGWLDISKVSLKEDEFQHFLNFLEIVEVERIKKFYHKIDQIRSLVGQVLIKRKLSTLLNKEMKEIVIQRDENNKPYVISKEFPNLNFNISHSGDIVGLINFYFDNFVSLRDFYR